MDTEISKYYITYIDKDYECDTYFPLLENMNKYHITRFEKQKCIDNNTRDKSPLNVYYIVFKKSIFYILNHHHNADHVYSKLVL